jgi:hypothetical protein
VGAHRQRQILFQAIFLYSFMDFWKAPRGEETKDLFILFSQEAGGRLKEGVWSGTED